MLSVKDVSEGKKCFLAFRNSSPDVRRNIPDSKNSILAFREGKFAVREGVSDDGKRFFAVRKTFRESRKRFLADKKSFSEGRKPFFAGKFSIFARIGLKNLQKSFIKFDTTRKTNIKHTGGRLWLT